MPTAIRRSLLPAALLAALAPVLPAAAQSALLVAVADATLVEDAAGALASGSGADLFVGRTNQAAASRRRALLRFDLTGVPRDAVVESARLRLRVSQGSPAAGDVRLHLVLASWGEGASASAGGGGAPAAPLDATWVHRFFDGLPPAPHASPAAARAPGRSLWRAPGGDLAEAASAVLVAPGSGVHVLEGPGLAADAQAWVRSPARNHGWALVGDESRGGTARRLASREAVLPDARPRLEVVYRRR